MNKFLLTLTLGLFGHLTGFAQQDSGSANAYRPKLAEFGIEMLMDYDTYTSSEKVSTVKNDVAVDRLYRIKMAAPLVMKDDRIFGAQLKYYTHRFFFEEDEFMDDLGLYSHLNTTTFVNTGLRLFYQENLNSTDKLQVIGGAEISSDQLRWSDNTSAFFLSGIYSRQWSNDTKMGLGFAVSHGLRRTNLYPILRYEREISPKWHLELSLPKSVTLQRKINTSNYLIGTAELRGWRYNLTQAIDTENRDLTLRKADLQFSIAWEKELHDWLWFELSAGYSKNLRYYLADPGEPRSNALINLRAKDARYAKVSLFLVPPRKFYK